MPDGWIHQALDLLCFGKTYWSTHTYKDAPSTTLPGKIHRQVRHGEWKEWRMVGAERGWLDSTVGVHNVVDLLNKLVQHRVAGKYPRTAPKEQELASIGHELLDYMWDDMGPTERFFVAFFVRRTILEPPDEFVLLPQRYISAYDYGELVIRLRRKSLAPFRRRLPVETKQELDRLSRVLAGLKTDLGYLEYRGKKSALQILRDTIAETRNISQESYEVSLEVFSFFEPYLGELSTTEQDAICRFLYVMKIFVESPLLSYPLMKAFSFLLGAHMLLKGSAQGFAWLFHHFQPRLHELEKSGVFPELSTQLRQLVDQMQLLASEGK